MPPRVELLKQSAAMKAANREKRICRGLRSRVRPQGLRVSRNRALKQFPLLLPARSRRFTDRLEVLCHRSVSQNQDARPIGAVVGFSGGTALFHAAFRF